MDKPLLRQKTALKYLIPKHIQKTQGGILKGLTLPIPKPQTKVRNRDDCLKIVFVCLIYWEEIWFLGASEVKSCHFLQSVVSTHHTCVYVKR